MKILSVLFSFLLTIPAFGGARLTPIAGVPVLQGDVSGATTIYRSDYGIPGPSLSLAGLPAGSLHDIFQTPSGTLCSAPQPQPTLAQITGGTTIFTGTVAGSWINASSAFDGSITHNNLASANLISNVGFANYIGRDELVPTTVSRFVIYAPTDDWIRGDVLPNTTIPYDAQVEVSFSDDNLNWFTATTEAFIATFTSLPGQFYIIDFTPTTHRYWRLGIAGDGIHRVKVNQLQFWGPAPYDRGIVGSGPDAVSDHDIPACNSTAGPIDCPISCQYLGMVAIDAGAAGQVSCKLSYAIDAGCGIWNAQNQKSLVLMAGDNRPGINTSPPCHNLPPIVSCFVYSPAAQPEYTFGFTDNNPLIRIRIISGLPDDMISARYDQSFTLNGVNAYWIGIGVNNSKFPCSFWGQGNFDTPGSFSGNQRTALCDVAPFVGQVTLNALEGQQNGPSVANLGKNNMLLQAAVKY